MFVYSYVFFLIFQCTLALVVSGPPLYAQLPSKMKALSSSCVQIPCTFEAPYIELSKAASIFGIWLKGGHSPPANFKVFNSSTNITKGFSHIEIVGNLRQRDCTIVFYDVMKNHSDNYYFRVEMQPQDWKYTYVTNPINISVSVVPKPLVLKPNNLSNVMEGSTVNLSCSADAPCPKQPPTISWSDIPESANITTQLQENPDKTQSVFSLMSFKASYRDHGKNISCTAAYPRNKLNDSTVETTVKLQILFPPKEMNITISPSASVSIGTNVTLICKSKANPSNNMNYTWYKRDQVEQLGFGEQLDFTVTKTSGGLYFCTAKNEVGNQTSEEIQLNVIGSYQLDLIIASVAGVAVFLFLFLLITLFLRVQRVKASIIKETDVAEQEKHEEISSVYTNFAFAMDKETETQKDDNGIIQYEEIDFSKPQIKITPANSSGVETVYAEVCRAQE